MYALGSAEANRTGGLLSAVGMVGSLIAAAHPAFVGWFGGQLPAYRAATLIDVVLWFVSLIPAFVLREQPRVDAAASPRVAIGLRHIRHPGLVARLATTGALLSVGYAAALPFVNVFFHEHLHADEAEIGTTFATASLFVAIGGLFAPLISSRLGKVRGVTVAGWPRCPWCSAWGWRPSRRARSASG